MHAIDTVRLLLLAVLGAPLVFALAVGLAGRAGTNAAMKLATVLAFLHLGLTVALAIPTVRVLLAHADDKPDDRGFHPHFVPGGVEGAHATATTWDVFPVSASVPGLPPASVQFFVGLDGINVWLVVLASVLTLVAVLSSWGGITDRAGGFYAWVFALQAAVTGAFLSFDLILFYVFFELTLIPAFFLIGTWGTGGGRRDAARKFFLYTFLGSLFTLTGFIGVAVMNPTPVAADGKTVMRDAVEERGTLVVPKAGPITFNVNQLMRNVADWADVYEDKVKFHTRKAEAARDPRAVAEANEQLAQAKAERDRFKTVGVWLFFAMIAGFAVKTPVIPFHTWLPTAYAEAPPSVTVLLTGALSKLGTLGMLRFVIPLAPDAALQYGLPAFGFLGAAGIVYAAFCAYAQRDLRLIAAYSSVSHLGLLVLGLFALNPEGLSGATLHMVNHGLSAGAMFALLGFLDERYRTTDATQFSGLIGRYPLYAFLMFWIALASVGLPGLNNFVSEMLLIGALFTPETATAAGYGLATAAGFGILLSAWYTMSMLRRVFFGPLAAPAADGPTQATDATPSEIVSFGIPAVLCLALGLFPQPLLTTMKADVAAITRQVDDARLRAAPGVPPADLHAAK